MELTNVKDASGCGRKHSGGSMKAVFRRMGAVVVAAILSLALAGCGQEVAKETIAVRIDGEAVPFLFRSRTVTQTTDIWEVLPVYGELEDAAPSVQPGEHRVGIDFSGCAFPNGSLHTATAAAAASAKTASLKSGTAPSPLTAASRRKIPLPCVLRRRSPPMQMKWRSSSFTCSGPPVGVPCRKHG